MHTDMNRFEALENVLFEDAEWDHDSNVTTLLRAYEAGRMSVIAEFVRDHVMEDVGLDWQYEQAESMKRDRT